MKNQESFKTIQYQFAAHLRNPSRVQAPENIEDRRLQVYRELFYNNVEGFVSGGFPVLRSLTGDEKWHRMVRNFFASYRCQTPYFIEISREFLTYLQTTRQPEQDDLPFMLELAHYEWVELAVDADIDSIPVTGFNPDGNLMQGRPVVSPLANVLSYQYPVHRICSEYIPTEPPATATFLIVYRDHQDQVRFMEINAVTARLLMLLDENADFTGADAIAAVARELPHIDEAAVLSGGEQALMQLRQSDIILGTELKPIKG